MSEPKIRLTQILPSATGTDSISGNVTITNDLTVGGNLTVSGDTTTLNVQTLLVEDNEIILNSNVTGSPSLNASVTINRGSSSNAFLLWNEGTDKWGWSDDGNTVTEFATAVLKTGDTMTGLLNVANDLVVTGNVGIGTSSPTAKLSVDGSVVFNESGADVDFRVEGDTDANLFFVDASTDRVGVGTDTPTHKFQASGSGRFGSMSTGAGLLSGSSDTFQVGLNQDNTNTTNTQVWAEYVNGASSASWAIRYRTANDTGTASTRLFLDAASGNLGLGVTPSAWDTYTAAQVQQLSLSSFTNGDGRVSNNVYFVSPNFKYIDSRHAVQYLLDAANGLHAWFTAPSGTAGNNITFTQAMTLDASGNWVVGGTTADVFGTGFERNASVVASSGTASVNIAGAAAGRIQLGVGTTRYGVIYADATNFMQIGTSTSLPISFVTNNTERARITSGGGFLVGTTNDAPNAGSGLKFLRDYDGSNADRTAIVTGGSTIEAPFTIYSTGAGNYRFYVESSGTIFATNTSISAISDQRLKENVRDLDAGLDEVMALKPRKFDWKEGKGANTKDARGFIAQEFEQVFPDLVTDWLDPAPEGEEPYKSVRQDLIPVLVKAIQELKAELDATKAEVAALKGAN